MFSKEECRVKWDLSKRQLGALLGGMLSPKLLTESFDQDQGIPVDTLLMVYLLFADDLVFRIC